MIDRIGFSKIPVIHSKIFKMVPKLKLVAHIAIKIPMTQKVVKYKFSTNTPKGSTVSRIPSTTYQSEKREGLIMT